MEKKEINIIAEPQIDPNVCRFRTDYQIYDSIISVKNKEVAAGSPLLESLFEVEGVKEIMVAGNTVTVMKTGDEDWRQFAQKIGNVMREKMSNGDQLISPDIKDKKPKTDPKLREKVQKVFDEYINPGIASHGGSVEIIDLQGTTLFLTLSGGCQGCAGAIYTLKYGIEQIVKEQVPEVTEIVDVTDHTSGSNPYM
jgi:Fe-S cluster biogenesis protein NfuA